MRVGQVKDRMRRRQRFAVLITALLALLFLGGTLLAPRSSGSDRTGAGLLRLVYAPLCHQQPERSLDLGDGPQAVCARCSGLYFGGTLGLISALLMFVGHGRRPRPIWLALAVAPTVVDALLALTGLPSLANFPRWLLALPAGLVAGWFLAVGVADLFGPRYTVSARRGIPVRTPRALEEVDG